MTPTLTILCLILLILLGIQTLRAAWYQGEAEKGSRWERAAGHLRGEVAKLNEMLQNERNKKGRKV